MIVDGDRTTRVGCLHELLNGHSSKSLWSSYTYSTQLAPSIDWLVDLGGGAEAEY
jgi:hypothetical protein